MNSVKTSGNNLVLLTKRYPYLPGEEFLEVEIKYLCEEFDEVHVVPTRDRRKFGSSIRSLPVNANLRLDIMNNISSLTARYMSMPQMRRFVRILADKDASSVFWREVSIAARFGPNEVRRLMHSLENAIIIRDVLAKFYGNNLQNIIFYSYWLKTPALAIGWIASHSRTTSVSRAHRGDLYYERHSPPYIPGHRSIIQSQTAVFLISENGYKYLEKQYPNMQSKFYLSRLGVCASKHRNLASVDGILRLASCSYMRPVKQLDLLVEALRLCSIKIHWTHIGDGSERESIEKKAAKLPSNIQTQFTGHLSNKEVVKFYQTNPVDIFINISKSEGLPVSIMEAISFGIPVIATAVGGTPELVSNQIGQLLTPNVTPSEIAKALCDFDELDEEQKHNKRNAAYTKWMELVNADVQYPNFAKQLKLLSRKTISQAEHKFH
jgi:glycosyltransferase involved in cell wall biosynthesis